MYKKVLTACAGLILLISSVALAGIPCAGTTTVVAQGLGICGGINGGAAVCPLGDYEAVQVVVTVRDCYGAPLAGYMVTVNPNPAGSPFCYCAGHTSETGGPTLADGTASVQFSYFGGCGNIDFYATTAGVTAGPSNQIYIASPDNSGDCVVNVVDFGNFATDYFGTNPCSDYNCDGVVNVIDFGNFATHYFHTCPP